MLFDLVISFSKKTSLSYKEMISPQASCFVRGASSRRITETNLSILGIKALDF